MQEISGTEHWAVSTSRYSKTSWPPYYHWLCSIKDSDVVSAPETGLTLLGIPIGWPVVVLRPNTIDNKELPDLNRKPLAETRIECNVIFFFENDKFFFNYIYKIFNMLISRSSYI
jgi:hypothetical protein